MPQLREGLADKLIVPPGKREVFAFDSDHRDAVPGFFIRKFASGEAYYGVRYTVDGKMRRVSLGKVVKGHLLEMRRLASQTIARARLGQDVMAERRAKQAAAADVANRTTLGQLCGAYLEARESGIGFKRPLRASSLEEVRRHLTRDVAPLHDREPKSIKRADLVQLLDTIAKSKGRTTADRVKASLSTFFKWLLDRDHIEAHPAIGLPSNGRSEETRPLTEVELRDVWLACRGDDYGQLVGLGILTALRRQNLGDLRWSEVDLDGRQLVIPGERMKNRRTFTLPLSEPAVEILRSMERRGEFIFGEQAQSGFSGWSKAKTSLDKRIAEARELRGDPPMPPWKLHGLRATFATLMNERDLAPPHIIDELLAHVGPHKASVAGRYNQAGYAQQRRQAMEAWGRLVIEIVAPAGRVDHSPHAIEAIPAE